MNETPQRTDKFPQSSRYYQAELRELTTPNGPPIAYLLRRLVPSPERFVTVAEHRVSQGERLDNLTAQYVGDPEQFWRVCDANGALWPVELEALGRVVRITLPEAIPAAPDPGL